jgi:alpha-L-fucosidase
VGVTSAVLTAKHGCGFLAWETAVTLPDGSPYRYHVPPQFPVLKDFVATMQSAGLGYGFYYSLTNNFYVNAAAHNVRPPSTLLPGQVNVTQQQYEAIILAQVTELWTQNGPLTEIWLDGGCGDLCDKVGALVKSTLAKDAVAFNGGGGVSDHPVRWCGTEGGNPSGWPTVWSTSACNPSWCPSGSGSGDAPNVSGAVWQPSGVDVTLQQGDRWFYMPGVPVHSLSDLAGFYHKSVGANGHLEIDFAIDRTGNVDPVHAARYAEFGAWIRGCYGAPVAAGSLPAGATSFSFAVPAGATFDRVMLEEDQTQGQLIVAYTVEALVGGAYVPFSAGVTVGSKRIDVASAAVAGATAVRVSVTQAFGVPAGLKASVFAPEPCVIAA